MGKQILIIFLISVFQWVFIPVKEVYASGLSSNMDVVFVMDSSGSMKESDPEEIRTEAVKMFLDMEPTKGDKVGFVAYSDSIVREHNLDSINSNEDKDRIKNMTLNIPLGQKTDTGAGLLEAVKLLDSGHDKNNRPLIILLSDGKNDPQRSMKESTDDLNNAINMCKSKGYPVYTIGLNYDGTVDKAQLTEISNSSSGKNYITNTAADLPKILTDIYADNSKVKVQDGGTITANGDYQDVKFNIPNSNVLEANISMLSNKKVEVKLIDPSGSAVNVPSQNVIFTSSKKYSMVKLVKPSEGQWTLKVKGTTGDNIKVSYVFNYDLQVEAKYSPDNPKKGDKIKVEAYFSNNGQKVSDKELYANMNAKLIVKSLKDNQVKEVPLAAGENVFKGEYELPDTGKYELKVRIDGNSFYRESKAVVVGSETSGAASKQATPPTQKASKAKSPLVLSIIGIIIAAVLILAALAFMKKKRVHGFGRVELQVKDINTGEILPPQFRNLDGYTGCFTLFEVLGLKKDYAETEKVRFIFNNDDSITLENKSECAVQKSGKKLDNASRAILNNGNRITVFLNKVSKSVTVEFHAK